ncbi:hypothetical protein GGR50DRAFT_703310 [Xylaria sp. CBS 124048]|nr:hypothetical protein GGR50DRAFT_703310 [Xylaria sp. CBS 124048]
MAVGESGTLSPLPPVVYSGSIVIAAFGITSFSTAIVLFLYLIYKLILWRLGRESDRSHGRKARHRFTTGPGQFGPAYDTQLAGSAPARYAESIAPSDVYERARYPNQFLVLIVNLLLADLHQATAFGLSTDWAVRNSIVVGSGTCFVQGLFVSIGDLASSCFMTAIAVHTFSSIVYRYRPPHKVLYACILFIWTFVILISLLPVAATKNGASVGGFFVRAGAWCWINETYGDIRLLTHYIFIFVAIVISWILYAAVFISLRRQHSRGELAGAKSSGYHHPAFLLYPIIYLICILPLAIGRVATMAGREPSLGFFCFSGALAASNGWLDVLLFSTTRHTIVFAHGDELGNEDTGVNTFAFMNATPTTFGNTTWVQGGRDEQRERQPSGGWWRILGDPEPQTPRHSRGFSLSRASATFTRDRNAIQLQVVTSVVVEDDRQDDRRKDLQSSSGSSNVLSFMKEPYR